MSAIELTRQVAALPLQEKASFLKMVHALEKESPAPAQYSGPPWPDFAQRLHGIYGNKVTPNSQAIIDEGRGQC